LAIAIIPAEISVADAAAIDASAPTANVASVNHTHIGGAVQPTIILNYIVRI
jgi:hypothetical protein